MKNDTDVILEQAIYGLLTQLPWYGALVQGMKHVITDKVKTLSVKFDENGTSIRLSVNPTYFAARSESERIALLIHEASHVDRLHLIRVPMITNNWRLASIAADAAINCYIPGLPKGGFYPKDFRLKNYQSFEWYFERLTDNESEASKPKQSKNTSENTENSDSEASDTPSQSQGNDGAQDSSEVKKRYVGPDTDSIDEHDWENSSLSVSEQAQVIESLMERAIEKMGLDAGLMPSHVQESLKLLKELKTKKWHKELKRFLGRTVNSFELERTWSRRNRRYGLLEAGNKVSGQKKLAICFDTSGSMSKTELNQALAETMAMVKTGVIGYLIQFDTQVNQVIKLKRSELGEIEILGRGGTSFTGLMKTIDELNCDAAVIFTDGEDADTCEKPKTPVLWVYTDNEIKIKYNWGFKTVIDERKTA